MAIIEEIRSAWGWSGLKPDDIVGENDFGNLLVRDVEGMYWRICPEELGCEVIAKSRAQLDKLSNDQEFLHDWYMGGLVEVAKSKFGPLPSGRKYCLKIPGVLGGQYDESNLATISLVELIRTSGHLANEVRDLPDGAQIRLNVVD